MEEEIIEIDLTPEDHLMAEEPPDPGPMRDRKSETKKVPPDVGEKSRQAIKVDCFTQFGEVSRTPGTFSSQKSRSSDREASRHTVHPTRIHRPWNSPGHPAKESHTDCRESKRDTQQTLKHHAAAKNGFKKPYNHTLPLYAFSSDEEELHEEAYLPTENNEARVRRETKRRSLEPIRDLEKGPASKTDGSREHWSREPPRRSETSIQISRVPEKDPENSQKNYARQNGGQRNQEPEKDLVTSRRPEKETDRELPQEVEDVSRIPEPEPRVVLVSSSSQVLP